VDPELSHALDGGSSVSLNRSCMEVANGIRDALGANTEDATPDSLDINKLSKSMKVPLGRG